MDNEKSGEGKNLIRQSGLRVTGIRIRILEGLIQCGKPVSHADVSGLPGLDDIDRVTIYRTLDTLRRSGLVHSVPGTDGVWRYCAHNPDQPGCPGNHPHFVCQSCGTMICLTGQRLPTVQVPEGYVVSGKRLIVHGLCPACAKAKSGKS